MAISDRSKFERRGKASRKWLIRSVMLANASIQASTTLQGLPLCAAFDDSRARDGAFVVSPRLDPRFRGDDRCRLVVRADRATYRTFGTITLRSVPLMTRHRRDTNPNPRIVIVVS